MLSSKLHCQGCSAHIRTIGKSATKKRQTNLILEQGDKNPCPGSRTNPITKSISRSRSLFTPKALTSRRVQEKSTDRMVGQWRLKGKGYISSDIFLHFFGYLSEVCYKGPAPAGKLAPSYYLIAHKLFSRSLGDRSSMDIPFNIMTRPQPKELHRS